MVSEEIIGKLTMVVEERLLLFSGLKGTPGKKSVKRTLDSRLVTIRELTGKAVTL